MHSSINKIAATTREPALSAPRWRVRLFRQFDHWVNRMFRTAYALHEGFWLGCLTSEDLNHVTAAFYENSQWYQSDEHNRSGLFDWESAAIKQYFRPGSRILVAAAGAGREMLALHREGFQVEGFECNPNLLQISRSVLTQNGAPDSVTLCAANEVPPGPRVFDALIVGWGAYSHIAARRHRIRFLDSLRQLGTANAPLLVSFLLHQPSNYDVLTRHVARLSRALSLTQKDEIEIGDHLSRDGFRHLFVRSEVESELKAAGFEVVLFSEESYGHAVGIPV